MKHAKFVIITLIAAFVLAGCSTRLGQFTAASSQNVRNLDYSVTEKSKQHVKGDSCIHTVILLPFGPSDDRLQRAMDDAIARGQKNGLDGDLLVNVRIDHSAWSLLAYGQDCVSVEGDLVALK